jgi:hypothetical protein
MWPSNVLGLAMNRLLLVIAGVAVVFATISPAAQSRGTISGWGGASATTSSSAKTSGFTTMGGASRSLGAGSVRGYSLPSTAGGVGTTSLMPSSAPLHLNPNGTLSHGVAPGSLSTNDNTGMLSMIASPTQMADGVPGVGNSDASVYLAQLASFSHGSSLMLGSSSGGQSSSSSPSSGGLLGRITSYLANASGSTTSNSGIPSSSMSTQSTIKTGIGTGTARMGQVPNKSCAGGIGASAHSCN